MHTAVDDEIEGKEICQNPDHGSGSGRTGKPMRCTAIGCGKIFRKWYEERKDKEVKRAIWEANNQHLIAWANHYGIKV